MSRVIRLQAENIKRITAIDITPPADGLVVISGENEQGKSSTLDCIPWALEGAAGIQPVPIHRGASKGFIRLTLGDTEVDAVVERKFRTTKAGEQVSELSVMTAEGVPVPGGPQAVVDAYVGTFAFDPEEFNRMNPREQFDAAAKLVHLELDLDALAAADRADYKRRTDINRDARAARTLADEVVIPSEGTAEPVDEAALVDELQAANDVNAAIERKAAEHNAAVKAHTDKRERLVAEIGMHEKDSREARRRADDLRREAELAEEATATSAGAAAILREQVNALGAPPPPVDLSTLARVDTAAIRQRIDAARATNTFLADRAKLLDRKNELTARAKELEAQSDDLTAAMAKRKATIDAAIAAAALPVPGLSFGPGIMLYDGVPYEQASDAARIRCSMGMAMAANPKLKVIRIRAGSMLDTKNKALVGQLAREHGFQVFLEQVAIPGAPQGFVIVDGAVAATAEEQKS